MPGIKVPGIAVFQPVIRERFQSCDFV